MRFRRDIERQATSLALYNSEPSTAAAKLSRHVKACHDGYVDMNCPACRKLQEEREHEP